MVAVYLDLFMLQDAQSNGEMAAVQAVKDGEKTFVKLGKRGLEVAFGGYGQSEVRCSVVTNIEAAASKTFILFL